MTITEVIAELERIRVAEGDLVVTVCDWEGWSSVQSIAAEPIGRPWIDRQGTRHAYPEKVVEIATGNE